MLDHFRLGAVIAAHVGQPALIEALVVRAVVAARHAAQQRHADLRAKACRQVQRILHRVAPAAAEVERAQIRVHFLVVGNRRHDAIFQNLDGDHILDARAHRMAGEALGVADDDLVGGFAKGVAQGEHFRRGAAAAGGRVGFVRNKGHLRSHAEAVEAKAALSPRHQAVHHIADVAHVQPRAMEGAVGGFTAQQLDNAAHPTLSHGVFALDHKGAGPHAQQRAMAATVKRQGRFFHLIVSGGRAGRQEAGPDPTHQVVAGHVVGAQHDHAAATAAANPVLGQGDALRRRGASSVDVRVRPTCADVFGKLAVTHRQDAEDEAAVKLVGGASQLVLQLAQLAVQLAQRSVILHILAQIVEHGNLLAQALPAMVTLQLVGEAVAAGEGAGEDYARLVAQGFRQQPAVRQVRALGRGAVGLHQRDARFAQGVDAGGNRKLRRDVQRLDQLGRHAILRGQVERAAAAGQLDHLIGALDHLEAAAAVLALDQARDALVRHLLAIAFGDQVNKLLAAQDAQRVVRVHHQLAGPRQAEARAGDDDRTLRNVVAVKGGLATVVLRVAAGNLLQGGDQRLAQRSGVKRRLCHGCTLFDLNRSYRSRAALHRGRSQGHFPSRRDDRDAGRDRPLAQGRRCRSGGVGRRAFQRLNAIAGGIEAAQRLVEALDLTRLGVVGEQRPDFRLAAQHVIDKALERALGANLDKHTHAVGVHRLQALHPLHGRSDLKFEDVLDALNRGRVALAGYVGDHLKLRLADEQAVEHGAQRRAGRGHDLGVEGMADGDALGAEAFLLEQGNRLLDGLAGPADHSLRVGVDVGGHCVAVHFLQGLLDHIQRGHDRGHPAVVAPAYLGHLGPAGGGGFERISEGHDLGGDQRAVFAQRVAHHHIRLDAVFTQQFVDGRVHRQHGGLRDGGLHQVAFGLFHRLGIRRIDKDVGGQRLAQDGRHHLVGFLERGSDDRFDGGQQAAHVGVLAALAGEEETDLARLLAHAAEDALRLQSLPSRRVVKTGGLARLVDLRQQFVMAAEVDHHAVRHAQHGGIGQHLGRRPAAFDAAEGVIQLVLQLIGRVGPNCQDAAQRLLVERLLACRCGRGAERAAGAGGLVAVAYAVALAVGRRSRGKHFGFTLQHTGHILFDDDMEVCAAKAIGADTGAARGVLRCIPRARLVEQVEGRVGKIKVGVGALAVERGRQHLVMHGHNRLEQPGGPGPGLQVADVALGRTQTNRMASGPAKDFAQAVDFGHVTNLGACAMRFEQRGRGRVQAGIFPRTPGGKNLPDRVGGRDALALAVRGSAHAADDGVDFVAVTFGVGEAAQQERGRAFAHDKAVGAFAKGAGAGGAECADLAEFDEGRHAHVAIDAAGNHCIGAPLGECLEGGTDGGKGRGAGGVGDKVWPAQVEHVGHAPGHNVSQFAGHGVFGNVGQRVIHACAPALQDVRAGASRQARKFRHGFQHVRKLRKDDAVLRNVVQFAAHGRAQDDADALRVQGAVGIAIVGQRLVSDGDSPLLAFVHGRRYLGRDAILLPIELEPLHPAADLGIGLVGRSGIRVVIISNTPAVGRSFGNAIALIKDIVPKGGSIGRIGENGANAYHRKCFI